MTDRELLELAAKAAGDVTHEEVWKGEYSHFERNGYGWNPLTDDGDALRLAVKLQLGIAVGDGCSFVRLPQYDRSLSEPHDSGCPYAATRRAIVRAAAELGRG